MRVIRVLLVEDDATLGALLARVLRDEGFIAHVLPDAETALDLLRSLDVDPLETAMRASLRSFVHEGLVGDIADEDGRAGYDLVLVDMRLPDMSGEEFVRVLRHGGGAMAMIPVILMSGAHDDDIADAAAASGANMWLAKPINPPVLLFAVEELLARRSSMAPEDVSAR